MAAFSKAATVALTAFAAGAAAATAAMGVAVQGAIDHADELNKASQKAGVAVESLSRLAYAAKLSDVALGQLTGGLQKLSKGMLEAANGDGPAKAFRALGVTVTDTNGRLRDSNAVFSELADRFSRMEDGSTKTALAIQIFGKSGADLIPLLNSGADGLARMADEADRMGATISDKTARSAEEFNDTLTRIPFRQAARERAGRGARPCQAGRCAYRLRRIPDHRHADEAPDSFSSGSWFRSARQRVAEITVDQSPTTLHSKGQALFAQ